MWHVANFLQKWFGIIKQLLSLSEGDIIQLFHASTGNSAKYFPRGAGTDLAGYCPRRSRRQEHVKSVPARGENVLHYCLFKLEITVLLSNYIYSHVTYHVTRQ